MDGKMTNAQVALMAAAEISMAGAATEIVLSRAGKFFAWLEERGEA